MLSEGYVIMEDRILEILAEINEDIIDYDGENMYEEGVISSMDVVEIVSELENEFDIEIDIDDIVSKNFANKETIIALVESML